MNFQGFSDELPDEWEGIVLHEFGHALGFEHEHQNPKGPCNDEFKFESDTGYVEKTDKYQQFIPDDAERSPGLYKWLGGPPNRWPRDKVDENVREFSQDSKIFITGKYDSQSIMIYSFPAHICKGSKTQCCVPENHILSKRDIAAVRSAYPSEDSAVHDSLNAQYGALNRIVNDPDFSFTDRSHAVGLRDSVEARASF